MSKRVLTIQLEDNTNEGDKHDDVEIVTEVLRLIRHGFTSGIVPTWSIDESSETS